jgi:HD-GYP domain-containing protein (c-di-GMP phosphodiesterase class II)
MSELPSAQSASLDQTLVNILAERLECEVTLVEQIDPAADSIFSDALADPGKAAVRSGPANIFTIALKLPLGGIATWQSEASQAARSAAYAETILALQTALNEKSQLQAEADALATQVVNDFEELSLIRSLASSLELPSSGVGVDEVALNSLRPLAQGVGAVSIAAVFLSEEGEEMGMPCWSGEPVTASDALHELIREHRDEAAMQPVVRNALNGCEQTLAAESLHEFVMVQCRSEGRLHGWLIACNRVDDAMHDVPWAQLGFTTVQASLLETATNQLAAQLHNMRLLRQKEELFTDVVRALVNAVEARDPYTCGHSERVAQFGKCLAACSGESIAVCERVYLTGLLHDIGKIAIPDGVLQKPGHLDENERAVIETHTEAGWRILHELEALRAVLPGVLYHHEHFNGNGYPDGLAGENIPLDGRILAVCDAFDAMTSDRPYRAGMPVEKAVEIIRRGAGSHWDPRLIEVFVANIDAIDKIRIEHQPRQQATRIPPVDGQATIDPMPTSV